MTGAQFSEVDFDLLADYVGGALDGTPDEAVVTALIEGHPTWRAAYRELTGGVAAVTADLRAWGAEPEPMPADVVARLDAAFASTSTSAPTSVTAGTVPADDPATAASPDFLTGASSTDASRADIATASSSADLTADSPTSADITADSSSVIAAGSSVDGAASLASSGSAAGHSSGDVAAGASGAGGGGAVMEPGSDGAAPARHLVAVPDDGERPATGRKRTRRLKWAAPVGIAAGVIAFVGVGIQQLGGESSADRAANSAAGSAAEQSAPEDAGTLALPAGPAQVGASDVDYSQESLSQVAAQAVAAAGAKDREPQTAESGGRGKAGTPGPGVMAATGGPLSRLTPQEALLACIDAIALANGAGPVTAQVVDYARFRGAPALIVQFTAANGTWVWAAGADCGRQGSGADRLGFVKVG